MRKQFTVTVCQLRIANASTKDAEDDELWPSVPAGIHMHAHGKHDACACSSVVQHVFLVAARIHTPPSHVYQVFATSTTSSRGYLLFLSSCQIKTTSSTSACAINVVMRSQSIRISDQVLKRNFPGPN